MSEQPVELLKETPESPQAERIREAVATLAKTRWYGTLSRSLAAQAIGDVTMLLVEVIQKERASRSFEIGAPARGPSNDVAESADEPDWVLQASRMSQREDSPALDGADAARILARNMIRRALDERGWTQADLAKQLGKKPSTISRILKDPTRTRVSTVRQIADALNLEVGDFLS